MQIGVDYSETWDKSDQIELLSKYPTWKLMRIKSCSSNSKLELLFELKTRVGSGIGNKINIGWLLVWNSEFHSMHLRIEII